MSGMPRFDNIFKRLDVELDRLQRLGVPAEIVKHVKETLLAHKPVESEVYLSPNGSGRRPTTPYEIAVNRYEGYKDDKYTWSYFVDAWQQCSVDDQQRLNEMIEGEAQGN